MNILYILLAVVGGWFGYDVKPQLAGFSDPFVSIQLATGPDNGECLTTNGTDNSWSTSCGSGGGAFEWTPTSWGNSTTTTLGFLNGFLSTASSTINAPLRLSTLSAGQLNVGVGGLLYSGASTTFSGGLEYSAGDVTANCVTITGSAELCDGSDATGAGSSIDGSGFAGMIPYWFDGDTLGATSTIVGGIFHATSTTATSTFGHGISVKQLLTTATSTFAGLRVLTGGLNIETVLSAILKTDANGRVTGAVAGTDYEVPVTAGDALTRTANDFDFDGGATPAGDLGNTWADPSVDNDSHDHTGATLSGIDASDTNLTAGDCLTLNTNDFDVDDCFLLNTGDTGIGLYVLSTASTTYFTNWNTAQFGGTGTTTIDSRGFVGIGTTTPGSALSVAGFANFFNGATSTIYQPLHILSLNSTTTGATSTLASGFNLTDGCFAIDGTCVGGAGGSGTVSAGVTPQLAWYSSSGTTLSGSSTESLTMGRYIATSTTASSTFVGVTATQIGTTATSSLAGLNILTGGLTISTLQDCNGTSVLETVGGAVVCGADASGTASGIPNTIATFDGSGNLVSTSSLPLTVGFLRATSTTGTSTFLGKFSVASGTPDKFASVGIGSSTQSALMQNMYTGNWGIGTATAPYLLTVSGSGSQAGINVLAYPDYTGIVNPGSIEPANFFNARGLTITNDGIALPTAWQPEVGIGLGANRNKPVLSVYNTFAGSPAFLVEGFTGLGTSTPGSILSIAGFANFRNGATSTIYQPLVIRNLHSTTTGATSTMASGFNLTGGCFSINGTCVGPGSGAPTDADYLVGTANGSLSGEIVVGTSPGGELGNTWASPTIDDGVTVADWVITGSADLPSATNPTVDAEGEFAFNTTAASTSIRWFDGTEEVSATSIIDRSFTLMASTSLNSNFIIAASTTQRIGFAGQKSRLDRLMCAATGGTFQLEMGDGTNWTATNIFAAGTTTITSFANNTWEAYEPIWIKVRPLTGASQLTCTRFFKNIGE